jgi:UDP-2,3-diacylglucosamine hydrolase
VFGHRHLPIDFRLKDNSRYINLGEWMNFSTYAIFDGTEMEVRSYAGMEHKIYKNW